MLRTEKGNHRAWSLDLARLKLGCIMLSLDSLWRGVMALARLELGWIMLSLDHCGGPKREITGLELVFQDLHLCGLAWPWLDLHKDTTYRVQWLYSAKQ